MVAEAQGIFERLPDTLTEGVEKTSPLNILEGYYGIKFSGSGSTAQEAKENEALWNYLSSKYGPRTAAAYFLCRKFGLPFDPNAEDPLKPVKDHIEGKLGELRGYMENLAEKIRGELARLLGEGAFVRVDMRGLLSAAERAQVARAVMETVFNWAKSKKGKGGVLLVMDEAHNFAGTAFGELSGGRDNECLTWARRLATEGRKFGIGLVLISQRVHAALDNTARSQANTAVLFRIVNANDIKGVLESYEGVSQEVADALPTLQTGEAFITGIAVQYPLLVRIEGPKGG